MQFKHRLLHLILLLPDSELVKYFLVRRNLKVPATMNSNKGTEWVYSKVRMYCSIYVIAEASSFSGKRNLKVWDHLNESSINECYTVWCTFITVVAFYRRESIFLIFCSISQSQIQQWLVKDFFYHSVHYTLYQVGNIKLNIFMLYKQIKSSSFSGGQDDHPPVWGFIFIITVVCFWMKV